MRSWTKPLIITVLVDMQGDPLPGLDDMIVVDEIELSSEGELIL